MRRKGKGKAKPRKKRIAGQGQPPPSVPVDLETLPDAAQTTSEARKRRRVSEDVGGAHDEPGTSIRVQSSPSLDPARADEASGMSGDAETSRAAADGTQTNL